MAQKILMIISFKLPVIQYTYMSLNDWAYMYYLLTKKYLWKYILNEILFIILFIYDVYESDLRDVCKTSSLRRIIKIF